MTSMQGSFRLNLERLAIDSESRLSADALGWPLIQTVSGFHSTDAAFFRNRQIQERKLGAFISLTWISATVFTIDL